MDVAIIGAAGECGRHIAGRLVGERLLFPSDRLQLVGRREGRSSHALRGLAVDLEDAFAEIAPEIDLAYSPDEVVADIIVFAAGLSTPADPAAKGIHRDDLARANAAVFRRYAEAIARHGTGREVVLVITNPVELGVEIFSRHLGRHRVIGIGAYSDTLRFRREIAADLGVRRQRVQGYFLGEHGDNGLPAWSTVQVLGLDTEELQLAMQRMRRLPSALEYPEVFAREKARILAELMAGRFDEAFDQVNSLTPDLRVLIKPYATHLSGARTAFVTAGVTMDLLRTLLDGHEAVIAAQVRLDGEYLGIHTSIGVPVTVSNRGWSGVVPVPLWSDEAQCLIRGADIVRRKLEEWSAHG